MKMRIALLPLALLLVLPAQAADFWEKKDYREWSERECRRLLEDSPWARQRVISSVHIDPLGLGPADPLGADDPTDPTSREREPNPRIIYQVQLRSAPPIRQALVRLAQISNKYDEMSAEEKQAFDQQAERFLSAAFLETVIVYVSYGSNVHQYDRELARHWQTQTTERLKNFVFLISGDGEKVPPLNYVAGEGGRREFQFVFPREYQGRPVLDADDKSLKVEFPHPNIGGQGERRVLLEFKVKDMRLNKLLLY